MAIKAIYQIHAEQNDANKLEPIYNKKAFLYYCVDLDK